MEPTSSPHAGPLSWSTVCTVTHSSAADDDILLCVGGKNTLREVNYLPLTRRDDGTWRPWVRVSKDRSRSKKRESLFNARLSFLFWEQVTGGFALTLS